MVHACVDVYWLELPCLGSWSRNLLIPSQNRNQLLGEWLYMSVRLLAPVDACKITGMLLELSDEEVRS